MNRKLPLVIFALLFWCIRVMAQTNVELIDQLVPESKSEHSKQITARTNQATVSANEQVNNTQMGTLKTTYRNIKSRFNTLGLVIDAGEVGVEGTPIVNEIVQQQEQIIALSKSNPVLIALALNSEVDLAEQANLLIDYSLGLILSIGDVNQMKASDRKMLFGYVITELRQIDGASRGLLNTMINFNSTLHSRALNPFANFINQDKSIVDDINRNAKALKN